jgi:hypothetical protein
MAASTMKIDSANIVTVVNGTANAAADVNTSVSEIVTKFNAALETSTGHNHDGTNSRTISMGVAGLTSLEWTVAQIMGGWS